MILKIKIFLSNNLYRPNFEKRKSDKNHFVKYLFWNFQFDSIRFISYISGNVFNENFFFPLTKN